MLIAINLSIAENIETCKELFETKVLLAGHDLRQLWRLFDLKIFYRTCRLLKTLKLVKNRLKQRFCLRDTTYNNFGDYSDRKIFFPHLLIAEYIEIYKDSFKTKVLVVEHGLQQF